MRSLLACAFLALPDVAATQSPSPKQGATPEEAALLRELAAVHGVRARMRLLLSRAEDTASTRTAAVERLLAREPGAGSALRTWSRSTRLRQRRTALAALVHGCEDDLVFALGHAIDDKSEPLRKHVFAVARRLGRSHSATETFARSLSDVDPQARMRAARVLAELQDVGGIAALHRDSRTPPFAAHAFLAPRPHVAVARWTC